MRNLYEKRGGLPRQSLTDWLRIPIVYRENQKTKEAEYPVMDVCLQAPNYDDETHNHHVVFDRVCLIDGGKGNDGFNGCGNYEDTGLELPFDEDKMKKLEQYVCERLERWCRVNNIDPKTGRHLSAED